MRRVDFRGTISGGRLARISDMERKSTCLTITLALSLSGMGQSLPQELAAETSTGVTAKFQGSGNTIANPKPAQPAPSRFEVEVVRPAIRPGDSPTGEQIPSFGGPLQFYANLPNLSAWSNGHIGVSRGKTPFGGDIILPFARGRAEMFGGVAGVYVLMGTRITRPYTWLTQTKFGCRVALDPEHHVWLGATGYYLTNFAEKTRQRALGSADLTIRFGR